MSMVAFHTCYDLVYLCGVALPWFGGALMDVWRASISWTFLLVAGAMCSLSRDNFKRSLRYLALALAIFAVTSLAAVDDPISFGIIFCMGASTLVYAGLERAGVAPTGWPAAALLTLAFVLLLGLPYGKVGIGPLALDVPRAPYECGLLSWLGFPGPSFVSGDYYPLLPYCLLYLAGAAAWRTWGHWLGSALAHLRCKPLELVGQHPLVIYVVHQPLVLGVLWCLSRLGVVG